MRRSCFFNLLFSLLFYTYVSSENIVIFTFHQANSQAIFNYRLAEALANAGHKVSLVVPLVNKDVNVALPSHTNITELTSTQNHDPKKFEAFSEGEHKLVFGDATLAEKISMVGLYNELIMDTCDRILSDEKLISTLREQKFDLAFHHHMDFCQMSLIAHLKIEKWVYMMSGPPFPGIMNAVGVPTSSSYVPGILMDATSHMSFSQRFLNFVSEIGQTMFARNSIAAKQTALAREKLGADIPDLASFTRTSSLLLLNSDPIIEYPVPVTQKVVYLSGIGAKATKPLTKEFSSYVDKAQKIVVISFGSVVDSSQMPAQWKNAFVELFRSNPDVHFVWKFEEDIDVPANVLRSAWIPQNDLLANEKVAAFISHGGYNSIMETVHKGVPIIVVPLLADQFRNSRLAEFRGFGVRVEKEHFSAEVLGDALKKILHDPSYKRHASDLQHVVRSRPTTPENELAFWVDLVLHSSVSLDLPPLNAIQLYNIDCILLLVVILSILPLLVWKLLRCYYWSCFEVSYKQKSD